ncbi:MAG TPA: dephospho-CoA kinase [Candidatus Limnocylindria bacterium]|nr:dephospho-CoA kinase [Candidatus Limnocylindria bacterium]
MRNSRTVAVFMVILVSHQKVAVKNRPRRLKAWHDSFPAMSEAKPLRFAVTGGIGCGKSATGDALKSLGVAVVDSDDLTHDLLAGDAEVHAAIRARFGETVFSQGKVNRRALGAVIFADPAARTDLEAILHPRIRALTDEWLASQPATQAAAVIIPLLYEVGRDKDFAIAVSVACSPATQSERLKQRGWSEAEISRRLGAQLPTEEKVKRAQGVIWTEGALENHAEQWRLVMPSLGGRLA